LEKICCFNLSKNEADTNFKCVCALFSSMKVYRDFTNKIKLNPCSFDKHLTEVVRRKNQIINFN